MVSKGEEGRDKLGIQDEQIYTGGGLVAKLCPTLVTPWTVARQLCPWTLKVKENFP